MLSITKVILLHARLHYTAVDVEMALAGDGAQPRIENK